MRTLWSSNHTELVLVVSNKERKDLRRLGSHLVLKTVEHNWIAAHLPKRGPGSFLQIIPPEQNGDLTDALILGWPYSPAATENPRWGWMNYQVRSLLVQLRDYGRAALVAAS